MSAATLDARVASVRAFNRFFTRRIGVLQEGLLQTPYSLTEARVIFELAQREQTEVSELRRTLDVDAGYLSRLLARLEASGLVERERSPRDGRRIGGDSLIGIGARLLSGCEIGPECLIAAGAVVTEGRRIPARSVVMGVPGKVVRASLEIRLSAKRGACARTIALSCGSGSIIPLLPPPPRFTLTDHAWLSHAETKRVRRSLSEAKA